MKPPFLSFSVRKESVIAELAGRLFAGSSRCSLCTSSPVALKLHIISSGHQLHIVSSGPQTSHRLQWPSNFTSSPVALKLHLVVTRVAKLYISVHISNWSHHCCQLCWIRSHRCCLLRSRLRCNRIRIQIRCCDHCRIHLRWIQGRGWGVQE